LKPRLKPAAVFVWLCAWLNFSGWALSALHQLNAGGYAVSLLLFAAGVWWWAPPRAGEIFSRASGAKLCRRFRRPLPALFLLVTVLIFLGGALYAPSNFDALTYRLPRLLNWWLAGHWFWIPTFNARMNYSGVAWEWIALPFLVLTHSDRALFLINALGFLLLPGLLFAIFRRLGVARRVAWTWMWLLPLAYGYVTQAGSIGNDLLGAIFCLLAVDFGLRARRSGRVSDVWLAGLAAALLTGVKLSNLPLALPCLVAVWPALGSLRKKIWGSLAVTVVAALISALPLMALNYRHTGSWNGDPHNAYKMQIANPVLGFLGNSFLLAEQSLMPPVLPGSNRLNHRLTELLPATVQKGFVHLASNKLNEIPVEEGAGLGLGVTLPLLLIVVAAAAGGSIKNVRALLPPVALAAWVAVVFYMAKMGSEAGPRLLLPYYPLAMVPFLLLPAPARWLRRRAGRGFLFLLALGVLPVLILSVARPLWPAQTLSEKLAAAQPQNPTLQRLATTYATYAHRNDLLAPLRAKLPPEVQVIGFIAGSNDTDYSLWPPLGRRQVKYPRADPGDFLQHPEATGWVVIKENVWPELSPVPLATWVAAHHGTIVFTLPITELVSWGPENWCLVHFDSVAAPAAGR
jgi:hypothetical protein